ncbi:hypothetical protein C1646_814060 [Rhizophagus diaphanus]|nr:hypothetical protein C1646_814060 [Rhizophagus diaphanus] [Rhizophagus sp. MUCL 43196]
MSDNSVIEINDDIDKIDVDKIDVDKIDVDKIDVDKIDVDKNDDNIFTFDNEPHNGKPIARIEISPNEKYLITYSKEDCSIVGWDKDKGQPDVIVKINEDNKYGIESLCVFDDKKLAYNYKYDLINIIDLNNNGKKIALSFDVNVDPYYCTFNIKGEFILYSGVSNYFTDGNHKIIWIYSTKTKNNKWECKRFYRIPEDYELISISKYDKVYLFSNDSIYEWNINTEKSVKIFDNNKDKNKIETKNIRILSNEKFNILKVNDKIIVYSIELGITIASLDINDGNHL